MEEDYTPLALEAVLLFHSGSPWDDQKKERWLNICRAVLKHPANMSSHGLPVSFDATTRTLCDIVRAAIAQRRPSEMEIRADERGKCIKLFSEGTESMRMDFAVSEVPEKVLRKFITETLQLSHTENEGKTEIDELRAELEKGRVAWEEQQHHYDYAPHEGCACRLCLSLFALKAANDARENLARQLSAIDSRLP